MLFRSEKRGRQRRGEGRELRTGSRWCGCREEGGLEEERKRRKKRKERRREKKRERRGRKEKRGEVEGRLRDSTKTEEGGCKKAGGGKGKRQGKTLGFEVRWAWAGVGLLSRKLKIYFSFPN